jgi:hypothetical protein
MGEADCAHSEVAQEKNKTDERKIEDNWRMEPLPETATNH